MKLLLCLVLILSITELRGQGVAKNKVDVQYYIKFDSGSLALAPEERNKIDSIAEIFDRLNKDKDVVLVFSGLCTESEIKIDPFLGVKRCKVIRDLFSERFKIKSIHITNDQIFPDGRNIHGVAYFLQKVR